MTGTANNRIQATARLDHYYRGYHLWRFVAFAEGITIVLIGGAMLGLVLLWSPQDRFFPVGPNGEVIQIQPLTSPNKSEAQLRAWIVTGVMECSTFGHHDWRLRLEQCREYFTDAGYEGYVKQLKNPSNQIWERIVVNRQVMSAIPTGTPQIIGKGIVDGRTTWKVEIPVTLSFKKGKQTRTTKQIVQLVISRVDTTERLSGLGITQWRAKNV